MKRSVSSECGFVYLVFGERCLHEAVSSANLLRRWHNEPICLITDEEPGMSVRPAFDHLKIVPMKHDYSDKLLISLSPYKKSIFLDSDTFVVAGLGEIFDILDRFDIGVQFTEAGNHYRLEGVPSVFREPSAGIIAWKKSPIIDDFFVNWNQAYIAIEKALGLPGAWDQRSLRQALYSSSARIFPIPNEYQFCTYRPNIVAGQVHMIHGRGLSSAEIKRISEPTMFRIWIPKVGWSPAPNCARPSQLILLGISLVIRGFQISVRRLLAWTKIMPYPVNRRPA